MSKRINIESSYREDCPKCRGYGAYTMTNCDDEVPIQCYCDDYNDDEWVKVKKEWSNSDC